MTFVGKWGNGELCEERCEKPNCNNETKASLANAKLITPVVQHGEHHAIASGKKTDGNLQGEDQTLMRHRSTLGIVSMLE
jgi:hypothetical protein